MTQEQFKKYCGTNVIVGIDPDVIGLKVRFINGESIIITSDYDGKFNYTHSEEPLPDNSELLKQLKEISPNYIEDIIKKYS